LRPHENDVTPLDKAEVWRALGDVSVSGAGGFMRIGMATVLCAVVVSLVAAQSKADGYAVCSDTQTGGTHIQCNSTSCPPGEVLISYNPGKHERCDKPSGGGDYDYRKGAEHC